MTRSLRSVAIANGLQRPLVSPDTEDEALIFRKVLAETAQHFWAVDERTSVHPSEFAPEADLVVRARRPTIQENVTNKTAFEAFERVLTKEIAGPRITFNIVMASRSGSVDLRIRSSDTRVDDIERCATQIMLGIAKAGYAVEKTTEDGFGTSEGRKTLTIELTPSRYEKGVYLYKAQDIVYVDFTDKPPLTRYKKGSLTMPTLPDDAQPGSHSDASLARRTGRYVVKITVVGNLYWRLRGDNWHQCERDTEYEAKLLTYAERSF